MIGYLIFASASLLGYSGGFVVMTAFEVFDVRISWPTFVFLMYNFAIVGVVAVFWQKVPGGVHACSHSYTLQCAATGHPARGDAGVLGGRELHHGLDRRQAAGGMNAGCAGPLCDGLTLSLSQWTSWALLIALALYDLCAVLTPCGPLRALVGIYLRWTASPARSLFSRACGCAGEACTRTARPTHPWLAVRG